MPAAVVKVAAAGSSDGGPPGEAFPGEALPGDWLPGGAGGLAFPGACGVAGVLLVGACVARASADRRAAGRRVSAVGT